MASRPLEIGTLNDIQIEEYSRDGQLIVRDFEPMQIRQACYELRSGNVYYDLTDGHKRYSVSNDGDILIKPHHMVVIITLEELRLPPDILGRILTKGAFFSLGLSPVNTYADPGFSGKLGIVMFNASHDYIRIPVATSIAKIEFSRLRYAVNRPYSGQHGYETSIWPIRDDLILTAEQIRQDPRIVNPIDELTMQHGELFGQLVKRVFRYERRVLVFAAALLLVNLLVLWALQGTKFQITAATVALGIISNLFTLIVTLLATNLRSK